MKFALIIIYLSIYIGLIAVSFYVLTFIKGRKRKIPLLKEKELPLVSVIIPAYNEEESVEETIKSVLKSDYPNFEVLFIDDGSKDGTLKIAKKFESEKVKVFHKKNGGKASALNFGIKRAKGEIIFTMDADTYVCPESMKKMVRPFKDKRVMSTTPAMLVHNPKSIWQRVQQIEYITGLFLRKVFALLNSIYIAPGAFSAYRKSFFEKYGGYDEGNITEDLEVALRIQYNGYITENCPDAKIYTIAPAKFKPLLIQRRRWYCGLMKNFWVYKKMISKKYGDLGLFVMPIAWISIFFSIFVLLHLFFKSLSELIKNLVFLQSINFDFTNFFKFNSYFFKKFFFLLFTNPIFIFIFITIAVVWMYISYATKKTGKIQDLKLNLFLFYLFFAPLFAIWWFISFIYLLFAKKMKW